jgi:hypothetical protein
MKLGNTTTHRANAHLKGFHLETTEIAGQQVPAFVTRTSRGRQVMALLWMCTMLYASAAMYQGAGSVALPIIGNSVTATQVISIVGTLFFISALGYSLKELLSPQVELTLSPLGMSLKDNTPLSVLWEEIIALGPFPTHSKPELEIIFYGPKQNSALADDFRILDFNKEWDVCRRKINVRLFAADHTIASRAIYYFLAHPEHRKLIGTAQGYVHFSSPTAEQWCPPTDSLFNPKAKHLERDSDTYCRRDAKEEREDRFTRLLKRHGIIEDHIPTSDEIRKLIYDLDAPFDPLGAANDQSLMMVFAADDGPIEIPVSDWWSPFYEPEEFMSYQSLWASKAPPEALDVLISLLPEFAPADIAKLTEDDDGSSTIASILGDLASYYPSSWTEKLISLLQDASIRRLVLEMILMSGPLHSPEILSALRDMTARANTFSESEVIGLIRNLADLNTAESREILITLSTTLQNPTAAVTKVNQEGFDRSVTM